MSFTKKRIDVSLQMANGSFDGGGNQFNVTGLRVSAHISVVGGPAQNKCELVIFGLPLSVMNQLSTVGKDYNRMYQNSMVVSAGDDQSGMHEVFAGSIATAMVDAQAMPNVCLRVLGMPGNYQAVAPADPISIQGNADAAQMMQKLAGEMGLSFENNGVTVKLANPYYAGNRWSQMLEIARHGNFDVICERGVMSITPADKVRAGGSTLISPRTGMIGYPGFNEAAVIVEAQFNPDIKMQGEIEIESDLTSACGSWKVNSLEYELESEMPHGKWSMLIQAVSIGETVP